MNGLGRSVLTTTQNRALKLKKILAENSTLLTRGINIKYIPTY